MSHLLRPLRCASALVAVLLACTALPAAAATGSGSPFVVRAQTALDALGCDVGPADGELGAHTRAGVVRFQAANGLGQSGRLTRETRARLYADRQVRCDDRPVVRSGTGRRVVISQRQNYVWLVGAGGRVVAQGGMADNTGVLSRGGYRVGDKCGRTARIRENSDVGGSLWLPYFVRFAPCGVGFHQIPVRKSTGEQIHADWMLGTDLQQSHGCIRVSRALAGRLWDFARVGTRVVVR